MDIALLHGDLSQAQRDGVMKSLEEDKSMLVAGCCGTWN
jgi:superfamily II DNA/RNA helicase